MRTRDLRLHIALPVGDADMGAEIDVIMTVRYTPAERPRHWGTTPPDPAELQLVKVRPVHPFTDYVELQQDALDMQAEHWIETDEAYAVAEAEYTIDRREYEGDRR